MSCTWYCIHTDDKSVRVQKKGLFQRNEFVCCVRYFVDIYTCTNKYHTTEICNLQIYSTVCIALLLCIDDVCVYRT